MSSLFRRSAVVAVAAVALTAGLGATAASARPATAPVAVNPGPDGGFHGGGHDRPLHFGPFEFPRHGSVSGGFSWGMR
ncbi:hypothetical protein [Streptomyces flavalbus]|uniref:Uncharacterized protein n=1 Tax=Streptomyces flavalbus TaxID=2665155 RepID=A0ABW2WAH4_9ACTN